MTASASTCCFSPLPTRGRSHALRSVLSPPPSEHQLPPEPPNPPIPPDPPPSSRGRPSSSLLHITSASSPPDPLLPPSLRRPLACSLLIVIHLHYRDQAKWYFEMCFHFVVMDLVRPVELPLTIYVLTLKTTCFTGQQISCVFSKDLWTRYGNIGVQSISLTTTSVPSSNVILSISMPPTPAAALSRTIQKALSLMSMVYNVVVESRVHIALYQRVILCIWTCFSTCSSNVSQLLIHCNAIDIPAWIKYAVEHGLRELELDPHSEIICLPRYIYACKTLEVLKLKYRVHVDVPNSHVCFKSLKILNLRLVHFKDDDSAQFTIHDFSDGDGLRRYVINAPSLNYFSVKGLKDYKFSIENTPELREAKIINVSDINTEKILLPLASSVKRLSLSLSFLETRCADRIVFDQLVYLELNTSKTEWWNLLMVLLLNSPTLQVLKLTRYVRNLLSRSPGKALRTACLTHNFANQLTFRLVCHLAYKKWERYNGLHEEERQIAMYILTNAKHLKEAKFSAKNSDLKEKFEMIKVLAREPRASPSCQFFFE
ncbi:FBD domain protein [Raphanus sativus]|nr:FBD domain protein [Raphanus sativus]